MNKEKLKEVLADAYEYSQAYESTSGTQGKVLLDYVVDLLLKSGVCK